LRQQGKSAVVLHLWHWFPGSADSGKTKNPKKNESSNFIKNLEIKNQISNLDLIPGKREDFSLSLPPLGFSLQSYRNNSVGQTISASFLVKSL
jgi:hypothetical protein